MLQVILRQISCNMGKLHTHIKWSFPLSTCCAIDGKKFESRSLYMNPLWIESSHSCDIHLSSYLRSTFPVRCLSKMWKIDTPEQKAIHVLICHKRNLFAQISRLILSHWIRLVPAFSIGNNTHTPTILCDYRVMCLQQLILTLNGTYHSYTLYMCRNSGGAEFVFHHAGWLDWIVLGFYTVIYSWYLSINYTNQFDICACANHSTL